jgi:hypothetical protein
VNTTTFSQQMQPVVASDGGSQFLVVWTGYSAAFAGFDLFAQRYVNVASVLQPMGAPFVYAPFVLANGVYQPQLQVSWPPLLGISVSKFEVYVDGSATPVALTTNNAWTMTVTNGLAASSTHSFQLDYLTTDGRQSPLSPSASGTTWLGYYWGSPPNVIPVEWMSRYYGANQAGWPAAGAPLSAGGPTLYQVFLSGGNPLDPGTWLVVTLTKAASAPLTGQTTPQLYVNWNTQPGLTYQVQVTTDFSSWSNVGSPRFASGNSDSIYVGGSAAGYYRVMLLRQ